MLVVYENSSKLMSNVSVRIVLLYSTVRNPCVVGVMDAILLFLRKIKNNTLDKIWDANQRALLFTDKIYDSVPKVKKPARR